MVLQFANNGNLRSYLREHFSELDWTAKIRMAKEISSGVNCLHRENIVHCDLHDGNILVHHGKLMITDFGLSKSLDNSTKSIAGGTCSFSDPQYIKNPFLYERNKSSDIYSLGVLFWELSSGVPPFKDMVNQTKIALHVINGGRETLINGTPIDFMNIYRDAWNSDPSLRPDIAKIRDRLTNMQMDPVYHSETTGE
ncbi:kinase-like domain-containing protein [Gigaspora rosea]|uniref:Kinase-like domain-containing protein n=1 Tax=Gigaspora rosea TaxID=44941 RepID=A0A397W633_9GLOM|nr:kinase-like domain-containing protein [Gigaspora rosea]